MLVVLPEAQQVRAQLVLQQVRARERVLALDSGQAPALELVSVLVSAQEPGPELEQSTVAASPVSAASAWAAVVKAAVVKAAVKAAAAWVQSAVSAARPLEAIPAQMPSAATR